VDAQPGTFGKDKQFGVEEPGGVLRQWQKQPCLVRADRLEPALSVGEPHAKECMQQQVVAAGDNLTARARDLLTRATCDQTFGHKQQKTAPESMIPKPFCLVAGQDLNLRPLGYEHHDARLPRLGRSLPDAVTSAATGFPSPAARLIFRVPSCSTASRLQIGLQNRRLIRGSPQISVPRV